MPSWSREKYEEYKARREASSHKPQQVVRHEPVGEEARKGSDPEGIPQCTVRITSYRRRLLDPDNLAGGCKYFLDCCKYCQLIPDDRQEDIELVIKQVKVRTKEEERTEIQITKL